MNRMVISALCLVALSACSGGDPAKSSDEKAAVPAAAVIGIKECDEYVAKYQKCVNEVIKPEMRPPMLQSLQTFIDNMKPLAAGDANNQETARQGCMTADISMSQTLTKVYGCKW